MCSTFLGRQGRIICEVTAPKRYSADLPQGGLEIPCRFIFHGPTKFVAKVRKLLQLARSSGLSAWDNEPISLEECRSLQTQDRGVSNPSEVNWIVFDGLRLSQFDKEVLYDGKQLNDNHAYQLHKAFSSISFLV